MNEYEKNIIDRFGITNRTRLFNEEQKREESRLTEETKKGTNMRVTKEMLENKVDHLNEITNSPKEYFSTDGKFTINIGHFCISGAYGGYELQRVCNNGGGVRTPLNTGHIPKKELYNLISAFVSGIEFNNK